MQVWSKAELRLVTYVFVWVDASVLHDSTDHSLHDCAKSTVVSPRGHISLATFGGCLYLHRVIFKAQAVEGVNDILCQLCMSRWH